MLLLSSLSDDAVAFLIARLSGLLKTDVRTIERCYIENARIVVETLDRDRTRRDVSICANDFLAVRRADDDDRLLGHLEDRITFDDPNAFAFIGLPGPTTCVFSRDAVLLIGANDRCRVQIATNNGAFVCAKCNYPEKITDAHLAATNRLIVDAIDDRLLRLFGLARFAAAPIEEANHQDSSIDSSHRDDSSSATTKSDDTERTGARTDRNYIELLIKHNPYLMENCIYYDTNYPIDRADVERLLLSSSNREDGDGEATADLTPRLGQGSMSDAGFYVYDLERGMWLPCSNISIEEAIVHLMSKLPEMNSLDFQYLGRESKAAVLRRVFMKRIESTSLNLVKRSLKSIDYFALNGGALVENGALRKSNANDAVFVSAGWQYDDVLAKTKRAELQRFLDQLFPLRDEQLVVLDYVADLLDGHRQKKGFLVLTDHRHGNNGKSAFLKLLGSFFGEAYYAKSVKFITSNTYNDKNSHDSSLESMNGKRLLVCDEFTRHASLDTAMIKDLVSVPDTVVQGRSFGRANTFRFVWQAGLILAFNEDQSPKFDTSDRAFLSRMIVCNMRSKFLINSEYAKRQEEEEAYTFPADVNIVSKFRSWNSAFLDLLLETRAGRRGDRSFDLPKSMIDSRDELILNIRDHDGQLCDWLSDLIESELKRPSIGEFMNANVLVINIMDVYAHYSAQLASRPRLHLDPMRRSTFVQKAETLCNANALTFRTAKCSFKRRYQLRKNGTNQQRRNVIVMNIK